MNVAAIRKYCAALPHATHDVKWGADHVYSIGTKMFCVSYDDGKGVANVSFKVDDDLFLSSSDRAGFIPAPYMARNKWVQVQDLRRISDAELKALVNRSYELVAMKLTRKHRAQLGIEL